MRKYHSGCYQQPPVKRSALFTACLRRGRVADTIGRARTILAAVPLIRTEHHRRGKSGWKAFPRACTRQLIGYLRETAMNQRVEEAPGKSAFRSLSLLFLRETNMAVRYHWSCDGSTSLLPYRTRKSILLLPTNTEAFSSKLAHIHWQRYLPRNYRTVQGI